MKIIEPVSVMFDGNVTSAICSQPRTACLDNKPLSGLLDLVKREGFDVNLLDSKKEVSFSSGRGQRMIVPMQANLGEMNTEIKSLSYELVQGDNYIKLRQVHEAGSSGGVMGGSYRLRAGIEGEICVVTDPDLAEIAVKRAIYLRKGIEDYYKPR